MSMPCETCPLIQGMPQAGTYLSVCGSPTPQCRENREHMAEQMDAWCRLGQMAEIGSSRVLDLRLLRPGDSCTILASLEYDKPHRTEDQAEEDVLTFSFEVKRVTPEGFVTAIVEEDAFHAESDYLDLEWPMPEDEEIVIVGSCDNETEIDDTQEDYSEEGHVEGMLHVGRLMVIRRAGIQLCRILVQDVLVTDPSGADMTIFDTYPYVFRPSPENGQY